MKKINNLKKTKKVYSVLQNTKRVVYSFVEANYRNKYNIIIIIYIKKIF